MGEGFYKFLLFLTSLGYSGDPGQNLISLLLIYRKIPNISPGLIEVRRPYLGGGAYIRGGLYSEGILC